MFFAPSLFWKGGDSMWIRNADRNGQEILDEVEIDGTLWVEIPDEKGVVNVQPNIEGKSGKNAIPLEACLEKAND
jgi:hypothetical protein